jgi:hypothetical protein
MNEMQHTSPEIASPEPPPADEESKKPKVDQPPIEGRILKKEKFVPEKVFNISVDLTKFLIPPDYNEKFMYDLPYSIKGTDRIPKFSPKNFIQRVIINQKPKDMDFTTIFYKLYENLLNALVTNDTAFINERCEKRFASKCIQALTDLQKNELKVNISLSW